MTQQTFDPALFESMLNQPEDKTMIPAHARAYLEIIGRLGPIFYQADQRSAEEYEKSIAPHVKEFLMDLKGKDYLPASARIAWFNEIYKFGFIFSFIFKVEEVEVPKIVPVEPGNPRNTQKHEILVKARKYHAGCVIFTGTGKIGMDDKEVCDADFAMALEKALTGATSRACARIGLGTREAYAQDDKILSDTPIEGKSLLDQVGDPLTTTTSAASNGHSNGSATVISTPKTPANTALKGSVQVTTRATIDPAPIKVDREAIKQELMTLMKPLSKEEQLQVVAYRIFLGIPADSKTWNDVHFTQALHATRNWFSKEKYTEEQGNLLCGYRDATMNRIHVQRLSDRLCGQIPMLKLNTHQTAYLLAKLAKGVMVYELASQLDPNFSLLTSLYKVQSPLDLLEAERAPEEKNWEDYCATLRARAQEKSPSEAFLKRYGDQYSAWLAAKN